MDMIIEKIRNGEFPDGSLLPSEEEITKTFCASRNTVRKAFKYLSEDGIIVKHQGRNSSVNASAVPGAVRPVRIAWLSKGNITDMELIYFKIYNSFLKEAEKNNANLVFVALQDDPDGKWFAERMNGLDGVIVAGIKKSAMSTPVF